MTSVLIPLLKYCHRRAPWVFWYFVIINLLNAGILLCNGYFQKQKFLLSWMSWIFWRGCTGKNNKRLKDANHGPWNSMIKIIFFFSSICNMLRARCCLACTISTFICGVYWCLKSNIPSIFHSRTASPILFMNYI